MHPRAIRRLLITRHDKIGDFVLSLPLCKAIKDARPDIDITFLVSRTNFDFARKLDFIDDVILYDRPFWKLFGDIKRQQFDASISCFVDIRLGAILWLSGIKRRIAPATKIAQFFFNHRIKQRRSQVKKTEWQYNLELGCTLLPQEYLQYQPPLIYFKNALTKNRVVFHPGFGGSSDGNLTLDDYLELAYFVYKLKGPEVVFTFGPDDSKAYRAIKSKLKFPATLIKSSMGLNEFSLYLAESRLLISTSTGPMHLAGAVNTPTLSFFGDNLFASSRRWATISEASKQRYLSIPKNYSVDIIDSSKEQVLELLKLTAPIQ